ncbi:MAG: hypothetical protein A2X86_20195 [Bdellovibrionales bacterium GWA2_49_15]|nr:MAG: hypothetical protein A2X86_20195 [Bdellovibrionales bacterium GWA2_49_15]HAZ11366.1 hypothetical protein [Bdellovibrionales bacterium]
MFKNIFSMIVLFFGVALGFAEAGNENISIDYRTVAVVLAQSPDAINIPSIELYRQIKESVDKSDLWIVAPTWTVKNNLKGQDDEEKLPDLGAIPSFDRRELIKAHPQAQTQLPDDVAAVSENAVIKSVQIILDTLAIEGALIVDCLPQGTQVVLGCGLYYYDRTRGKVVASSRKYFRAGVTDATNWAEHLIVALDEGIKHTKEVKTQAKLEKVLTYTDETESPMQKAMGVEIWGKRFLAADLNKTLPGTTLCLLHENENYSFSFGASFGQYRDQQFLAQELGMEIKFTPRVYAARALIWELPIGMSFLQRDTTSRSSIPDDEDSTRTELNAVGDIGPALLWRVQSKYTFGLGVSYQHNLNVKNESKGAHALEPMKNGFKAGFRWSVKF